MAPVSDPPIGDKDAKQRIHGTRCAGAMPLRETRPTDPLRYRAGAGLHAGLARNMQAAAGPCSRRSSGRACFRSGRDVIMAAFMTTLSLRGFEIHVDIRWRAHNQRRTGLNRRLVGEGPPWGSKQHSSWQEQRLEIRWGPSVSSKKR